MGVSGSSDENDSWGNWPSGSAGLPVENKGHQVESSGGAAAAETAKYVEIIVLT